MEKHLNNIERASATWLHQKSINALEGLHRDQQEPVDVKSEVEKEVKAYLTSQNLNHVSGKNSKVDLTERAPNAYAAQDLNGANANTLTWNNTSAPLDGQSEMNQYSERNQGKLSQAQRV